MSAASWSPLISIVIPTRDRPEFAAIALKSLIRQSFQDFEIIVSDNALQQRFVPDPRVFDNDRVRYVRPPKPLWMTDHYEFAVAQARGRYVGVLGDKAVLVSGALKLVAAEIQKDSPEAISWRVGNFQPATRDLCGQGVLSVQSAPSGRAVKVPAAEALEYLIATYLEPNFEADHQLEIRGSIYHGVFSAALLSAMKERFGRIFRFYAPDISAQCAAMQIAKAVTYIPRPLELVISGPSNGFSVVHRVSQLLGTQAEAASGASGASPPLIPNVSSSNAHLLASDIVAVSGRTLRRDQWIELHARAMYDLHYISDWPDASFRRSQLLALRKSAAFFEPEVRHRMRQEAWKASYRRARALAVAQIRSHAGFLEQGLRRIQWRHDTSTERRSFDHLFVALDMTA